MQRHLLSKQNVFDLCAVLCLKGQFCLYFCLHFYYIFVYIFLQKRRLWMAPTSPPSKTAIELLLRLELLR